MISSGTANKESMEILIIVGRIIIPRIIETASTDKPARRNYPDKRDQYYYSIKP
jgi:hypothetical protein